MSKDKMYIRLCRGLEDKGTLIPANSDPFDHIKDNTTDWYTSVYQYDSKHREQFQENGTIAGITNVTTSKIIFDFDSKTDIEVARKDTISTIERLEEYGIDRSEVSIFYSGQKGFHLIIDTDQTFKPSELKQIAKNVAKDLTSFDSVVYNAARILRIPNTKHPETGLYKIAITLDELCNSSIKEIQKLATEAYMLEPGATVSLSKEQINRLKGTDTNINVPALVNKESTLLSDLDLGQRPKDLSPWKYALEQGFFPPGQRSNSLMILAATYKALGYNETKCYHSLKAAAELQAQRFDSVKFNKEEIYKNIINTVYDKHWNGGTYAEDNFPVQLQDYLTELGVPRRDGNEQHDDFVVDINKGFNAFAKYAEQIDANTMTFGIPDLDNALRVQVGHLIGILAGPGVGKTSMALTLLNNTSKQGIKSFFASYDMAGNILIQKLAQRETRLKHEALYDIYRNDDTEQKERIQKLLQKNYANVSFCFKCGQTVQDLRESIKQEEMKLGEPIKLVIVDYLELIQTRSMDPTISSAEAIQGLREIANEGRVVVCLLQPNKLNSTPSEPLLTYNAAKGSSAIAQAVTSMITCHRPGFGDSEEDQYFSINIVKNRMGPMGSADFSWEGLTGRIGQLEDIQKDALRELREYKKAQKDEKDRF